MAQFAIVRGLHTSTHFPHTLVIAVTERPAVAALVIAGARTAVAADGLVLGPAVLTTSLPSVSARWQPQPGQSVHEGGVLAELAVLGAAPKSLAARVSSVYTGRHGVTVAMRNGLLVYFGDAERAHAKWLALERVLLDEGSAGAGLHRRARCPNVPAAGGFAEGVPPPVSSRRRRRIHHHRPGHRSLGRGAGRRPAGQLAQRRLGLARGRRRTHRRQPLDVGSSEPQPARARANPQAAPGPMKKRGAGDLASGAACRDRGGSR